MFSQNEDGDSVAQNFDLSDIQESGEIIIGTLSGPDSYFEYRGRGFGLQYELAEEFAKSIGAQLRVEVAHDTTEVLTWLNSGEVDMVAMKMPQEKNTIQCKTQWLVNKSSEELAKAVDEWYKPDMIAQIQERDRKQGSTQHVVRMHARPAMLNAGKGIISSYDAILQKNAASIGWDWRLLAAQCYQESGFDPKAESWAGAQGLMQIMPSTAASLGLTNVWNPEDNIAAAAKLIKQLSGKFSDIADRQERISYILAAYNGGPGHVRDAMALAQKNGKNPKIWRDVSPYIRLLAEPRFYHDPVVKYGYLRGSETDGYVTSIMDRWRSYCGQVRHTSTAEHTPPKGGSQVRSRESFMLDDKGKGSDTESSQ